MKKPLRERIAEALEKGGKGKEARLKRAAAEAEAELQAGASSKAPGEASPAKANFGALIDARCAEIAALPDSVLLNGGEEK